MPVAGRKGAFGVPDQRATVCLTLRLRRDLALDRAMGATSPSMISRGEFGAVGVERILRLLDRAGITATFFVTGHTADTYPTSRPRDRRRRARDRPPRLPAREPARARHEGAEREVLLRGLDALERAAGVRPVGYRSPAWDNSPHTIELLLESRLPLRVAR